jgi:hypothetical protein
VSYATKTEVPFEKSIAEIITLIKRHGAMQIGQFEGDDFFAIQFSLAERMIRFRLPIPAMREMPTRDGRGVALTARQRQDRLAQTRRSRGRALLLVIKAKLESVESSIETIEQAFLANVVLSDGQTVYERVAAPIAIEYQDGRPDPAVGLLTGPRDVGP